MPQPSQIVQFPFGQVFIFPKAEECGRFAADRIVESAQQALQRRGKAVLGLATGGTPIGVYAELVARHRAGTLSFRDVTTYNLDEYYPIRPLDPNSYRYYMDQHLLAHVDLPPNRAHVLDGTVPEEFVGDHCRAFDAWIAADGGLDLQLLGIGRNGHIGFNEPTEAPVEVAAAQPTRLVDLHPVTTADAAKDFGGDAGAVPRRALTMGTATILAARTIVLLATGPAKAEAVAAALRGPVTAQLPASMLQDTRSEVVWILDKAAAALL